MASSTQDLNEKVPILLICPICHCSLVEELSRKLEVVRSFCGHVYHETCLKRAYDERNLGKQRVDYEYVCPLCFRISKSESSSKILLEPVIDRGNEDRIKQIENLMMLNHDLTRKLNVSELRLMVLRQDTEELRKRFDSLKWEDLTEPFQCELIKKLELTFNSVNIKNVDFSSLSSETLFELMNSEVDKNALMLKFTHDVYKQQASLNEKVTLYNFQDFFKYDLFELLRNVCKLSSLDLNQLPVSPKILQMLLNTEENLLCLNRGLILKILETYLHEYKRQYIQDLFRIMLVNLISKLLQKEKFHFKFEMQLPFLQQSVVSFFEITGILKRENGVLDFVHDSIKFYFVGLISLMIKEKLGLSHYDALKCFYGESVAFCTLEWYCIQDLHTSKSFDTESMSIMENEIINAFPFSVTNNLDLLVILIVLKLENTNELAKVLGKFERLYAADGRNIWELMYPCMIDSHIQYFTLLQFTAIRSDLAVFKKVYEMVDPTERSMHFDFRKLIRLCGYGTLFRSNDEIEKRIEVISFILTLNDCIPQRFIVEPDINCLTVHVRILQFVAEMGMKYFRVIWNINHVMDIVSPHVDEGTLHIFTYYFLEELIMKDILDLYSVVRPLAN